MTEQKTVDERVLELEIHVQDIERRLQLLGGHSHDQHGQVVVRY
jgi:hypothetical protein